MPFPCAQRRLSGKFQEAFGCRFGLFLCLKTQAGQVSEQDTEWSAFASKIHCWRFSKTCKMLRISVKNENLLEVTQARSRHLKGALFWFPKPDFWELKSLKNLVSVAIYHGAVVCITFGYVRDTFWGLSIPKNKSAGQKKVAFLRIAWPLSVFMFSESVFFSALGRQ